MNFTTQYQKELYRIYGKTEFAPWMYSYGWANSKEPCIKIDEKCIIFYNYEHKLHRIDGPSMCYADGATDWHINGKHVFYEIRDMLAENGHSIKNLDDDAMFLIKLCYG